MKRIRGGLFLCLFATMGWVGCGDDAEPADDGGTDDASVEDGGGDADGDADGDGDGDAWCPRVVLEGAQVYHGDTTGLPNSVTSARLEFGDYPDDTVLFRATEAGSYLIYLSDTPASLEGCGASTWDYALERHYVAADCPADGVVAEIDGVFTGNNPEYDLHELVAGDEVLVWISCAYWETPGFGPYELTIEAYEP